MNGYSMLGIIGTTKSRSMDFSSDLLSSSISFPETSDPKTQIPETKHHQQQIKNNPVSNNNIGEKFGSHLKLSRNSSVSSSASALQSAVQRAFSMRRSSSVSERYCRIHDQSLTLASPVEDEDWEFFEMGRTRSVKILKKRKNNKSKILKACKKIFGL